MHYYFSYLLKPILPDQTENCQRFCLIYLTNLWEKLLYGLSTGDNERHWEGPK